MFKHVCALFSFLLLLALVLQFVLQVIVILLI